MAKDTKTWPELAIGLYDQLTSRNAEITYEFEKMKVYIPSGVGHEAKHAVWVLDGILKIRTQEKIDERNHF